ncbi:MAG: DedA family protein [Firmicutes bacterium]|nr:DedA family protein [Bacillota bacterium]
MGAFELLDHFMSAYGYWALFLALALETMAVPVFSEIILAYTGYLVALGHLSFWPALAAAVLGTLAGAAAAYAIGLRGGRPLLERFGRRWLPPERVASFEARLNRSLGAAVFAGRLLSGARSVSAYLGGVFRLPFGPFLFYSALGALVWSAGVLLAGMALGERWHELVSALHAWLLPATLALAALGAAVWWVRRRRATR